MGTKIICTIIGLILLTSVNSFSQEKIKYTKKTPRNSWSLGLNYGENGFGPYVSMFAPIGKTTDLTFNLAFSGVSDEREIERFDVFGNSIIINKVNRVFQVPFSIGIRKELFKNDIEGSFTPIINFGISPTLVITNPYDRSFFNAIGYSKTHFAFGGYGGIGVSFSQSESMSMNVSFNYSYVPLIGDGVQSLNTNTITNVGGFQLAFGVNFLK
ncbi:MAG: hypothetical protein ABI462_02930 [Ignavibacteria bacterium]